MFDEDNLSNMRKNVAKVEAEIEQLRQDCERIKEAYLLDKREVIETLVQSINTVDESVSKNMKNIEDQIKGRTE